jgi:hypothetical protein
MGVNCTKDDADVVSATAVAADFLPRSSPVLTTVKLQLTLIPTAITRCCSDDEDSAAGAAKSSSSAAAVVDRKELQITSPGCSGRKRRIPKPNTASQRNLINGGGIQSPLPGCTFRTVLDFNEALPLTDIEAAASANPLTSTRAHTTRQQRQSASASSGNEMMALERGDDEEDDGLIDMSLKAEDEDTLLASRASSGVSTASRVSRRSEGDRSVTFESHVIRLGSLSPQRNNSSSSGSIQGALSNGSTRATARRQRHHHHLTCVVTNNATLLAQVGPIEASSTAALALPIPSDLQSFNASMSLLTDSLHMSAHGASSYRAADMLHVLGGSASLVPM